MTDLPPQDDIENQLSDQTDDARDTTVGSTSQRSEHDSSVLKKRLATFGIALIIGGLSYGLYSYKQHSNHVTTVAPPKPVSTFTPQTTARPDITNEVPILEISPTKGEFGNVVSGDASHAIQFTLTVKAGTYTINSATIPYGDQLALSTNAEDCTRKTLHENERCTIQVMFAPSHEETVSDTHLAISVTSYAANGASHQDTKYVPINAKAAPPAPVAQPPAQQITTPPPAPAQEKPQTPPPVIAQEQPPAPPQPDPQDNYFASRKSGYTPLGDQGRGSSSQRTPTSSATPPAQEVAQLERPIDPFWQNSPSGGSETTSSYPVDMTRILTADNPIPATIQNTVDTRYASPVTASVERDLYGEDGRTVIIERGSILYGSASSAGSGQQNSNLSTLFGQSSSSGSSSMNSMLQNNQQGEKVTITWKWLRRPDGVRFDIGSATTGDAMGRGGVLALIDDRTMERFGPAVMASVAQATLVGLANGSQSSTNTGGAVTGSTSLGGTTTSTLNGRAMAAQAFEEAIGPALMQYIQEHLSMQEIRVVPAGTRITVWLAGDLILKPPMTKAQAIAAARGSTTGIMSSAVNKASPSFFVSSQGNNGGPAMNNQQNQIPSYQYNPGTPTMPTTPGVPDLPTLPAQ